MKKLLLLSFSLLLTNITTKAGSYLGIPTIEVDGIWYYFDNTANTAYVACQEAWDIDSGWDIDGGIVAEEVDMIGTSSEWDYTGSVLIPETVKYDGSTYRVIEIASYAFKDCSSLTSVTIPGSVKQICPYAFARCGNLTSIIIPEGVENIQWNAFYQSNLTEISIPSSLTYIGGDLFSRMLVKAEFASIESIFNIVYDGEYSNPLRFANLYVNGELVTDLVIPNGVTSIGRTKFLGCTALTSVTIPASVKAIGYDAFNTGIRKVVFEDGGDNLSVGVEAYRDGLFSNSSLETLYLGRNLSYKKGSNTYGYSPFFNCKTLKSVTIGANVTQIDNNMFSGCTSVTELVIMDGEDILNLGYNNTDTQNGQSAPMGGIFADCPLGTLYLGRNLSYTYDQFKGQMQLSSLTIGSSVTSIGSFAGSKLRNLMVKSVTPPEAGTDSFSEQTYYHTTLYIPTDTWEAYAYDDSWYKFINIRETAKDEAEVRPDVAYTLMGTKSFTYMIYDVVNNCLCEVSSASVDESNPFHCWQVVEKKGLKYLYNIGAKKFAVSQADGMGLYLTNETADIAMEDGQGGIILGDDTSHQWLLVVNGRMGIDMNLDNIVTGIGSPTDNGRPITANATAICDLNGRQLPKMQKGINILRQSDGMVRKVMAK